MPAGEFANERCLMPYKGQICVDLEYNENNPRYAMLQTHLENPDGTMRDPNVCLYLVTLEEAMANVHHDEPGFWERWADDF